MQPIHQNWDPQQSTTQLHTSHQQHAQAWGGPVVTTSSSNTNNNNSKAPAKVVNHNPGGEFNQTRNPASQIRHQAPTPNNRPSGSGGMGSLPSQGYNSYTSYRPRGGGGGVNQFLPKNSNSGTVYNANQQQQQNTNSPGTQAQKHAQQWNSTRF